MLTFGGMQWRLAGLLIPFTTLHSAFARWTRLWRRLGQRLALDWRIACGDEALPSALVVDSNAHLQPASPAASMAARASRASNFMSCATSMAR